MDKVNPIVILSGNTNKEIYSDIIDILPQVLDCLDYDSIDAFILLGNTYVKSQEIKSHRFKNSPALKLKKSILDKFESLFKGGTNYNDTNRKFTLKKYYAWKNDQTTFVDNSMIAALDFAIKGKYNTIIISNYNSEFVIDEGVFNNKRYYFCFDDNDTKIYSHKYGRETMIMSRQAAIILRDILKNLNICDEGLAFHSVLFYMLSNHNVTIQYGLPAVNKDCKFPDYYQYELELENE